MTRTATCVAIWSLMLVAWLLLALHEKSRRYPVIAAAAPACHTLPVEPWLDRPKHNYDYRIGKKFYGDTV